MKNKPKILIVDDEPINVEMLKAVFMAEDYEIVTASSGKEVFKIIAGIKLDLILLDAVMPEMDGFEVLQKLRSLELTRLIPIVFVTSLKEREDRIKGIEAGCDDFISKPYDKNEILARVNNLLKLNYYRLMVDEKEKFDAILNQMNEGLLVLNKDLKISRINQRAQDLLAIDLSHTDFDFFTHLKKNFIYYDSDLKNKIFKQEICVDFERPETENFKPLILEMRNSIIKNPLGETTSHVFVLQDVTAQRKKQFFKYEFLELISHKLRTPLSRIMAHLSILETDIAGELNIKQKEFINKCMENSLEFKRMINNILEFLALDKEEMRTFEETIDLKNDLPHLFDSIMSQFKDKKAELNLNHLNGNSSIKMNRSYYKMILGNLIENAVIYNDNKVANVAISVHKKNGHTNISVKDNGRGIPPEEKENIFQKFYQLDKWETGNIKGMGLGLTIVQNLITAYGGNIDITSKIGKGSTFTVSIPNSTNL